MRRSSRFWLSLACLALPFLLFLPGKPAYAADNQVTFIFGVPSISSLRNPVKVSELLDIACSRRARM